VIQIDTHGDPFADALAALLTAAHRGAADAEEVLASAARIESGNADAWVDGWTVLAGSAWADAKSAVADGRHVSALAYFRRAASYYAAAVAVVSYSSEPERHLGLWRRQRACWELAASLLPIRGSRIAIPYEGSALPGYFFSAADEPRPLVVVVHGDGPTSHAWLRGGAAAAERGHHWMTFDGPGQEAALLEHRLAMRPDWESVLTPVIDAMLARDDVDPARIAVIGTGFAGYLVTRALTREHRLAAAVSDPGVVDLSAPWIAALPAEMRRQLADGDRAGFDRDMHLAELFEPALTAGFKVRGTPYALGERSRYRLFTTVSDFRLDGELQQLATPLLVTDDGNRRWPGQAQQLAQQLPGHVELLRLAGRGSVPSTMRDARIMDWLAPWL
jgi:hypothetical protein